MNVKTITNEYHTELRQVICDFCGDIHAAERCESSLRDASIDDSKNKNPEYVYDFPKSTCHVPDMTVIKLDEFAYLLASHREHSGHIFHAVDAVCINNRNQWFLIEFKNQKFDEKEIRSKTKDSIKSKMLSSLWMLYYIYPKSKWNNLNLVEFAQSNVEYIVVCSSQKNTSEAMNIHHAEAAKCHYTPNWLKPFVGYCFKNVYLFTERELRVFVNQFS